jgi:hypothetical protein
MANIRQARLTVEAARKSSTGPALLPRGLLLATARACAHTGSSVPANTRANHDNLGLHVWVVLVVDSVFQASAAQTIADGDPA